MKQQLWFSKATHAFLAILSFSFSLDAQPDRKMARIWVTDFRMEPDPGTGGEITLIPVCETGDCDETLLRRHLFEWKIERVSVVATSPPAPEFLPDFSVERTPKRIFTFEGRIRVSLKVTGIKQEDDPWRECGTIDNLCDRVSYDIRPKEFDVKAGAWSGAPRAYIDDPVRNPIPGDTYIVPIVFENPYENCSFTLRTSLSATIGGEDTPEISLYEPVGFPFDPTGPLESSEVGFFLPPLTRFVILAKLVIPANKDLIGEELTITLNTATLDSEENCPVNNTDVFTRIIKKSIDPNYKRVLNGVIDSGDPSIRRFNRGDWVDFEIGFENIARWAERVISINDTLDSRFEAASVKDARVSKMGRTIGRVSNFNEWRGLDNSRSGFYSASRNGVLQFAIKLGQKNALDHKDTGSVRFSVQIREDVRINSEYDSVRQCIRIPNRAWIKFGDANGVRISCDSDPMVCVGLTNPSNPLDYIIPIVVITTVVVLSTGLILRRRRKRIPR